MCKSDKIGINSKITMKSKKFIANAVSFLIFIVLYFKILGIFINNKYYGVFKLYKWKYYFILGHLYSDLERLICKMI